MGGRRVILDAGTGIRNLGHWFLKRTLNHAHILFSHTHWDHINGFPFFAPAFDSNRSFTIMAGHLAGKGGIHNVLSGQMAHPTFPVPIEIMNARLEFEDFNAGDTFSLGGGIKVRTCVLNHPDSATAYRLEYQGRSLCYVTDTEHVIGKPDENVLALIEGADLVIYDSTYTDKEFPSKIGWGHSTWEEGVRLCRQANAKRLMIFHHDPDHEDLIMERIESDARYAWDNAIVARENSRYALL
ncbi:MBL fold metallo-hydrolase [Zavarzinia sp. CC-PAN008]|uniref:MBL fold metallo-hydrolase n=1 Tax=Zavarzinia sp. CC-PAN008 TaxID=3243332 RepID=UPI003F74265A